jgi:hypothetical protein
MERRFDDLDEALRTERYVNYAKSKISKALMERRDEAVAMICPATLQKRKGLGRMIDALFGEKILLTSTSSHEKAIRLLQKDGYKLRREKSVGIAFRVIAILK